MTKAVIYCRVSTKAQEDGASLETQEEGCRALCAEQGHTVLAVQRDVHTGADMDRPGLQAALETIRTHKAGVLVTYALDRLSRNQTHQAVILYQIEEQAGAKLELVTEKLDDTPHGRFLRQTLGFVAELEREKIKERTWRGKRKRAENGALLPGAVVLYGYKWTDDTRTRLEPDPETAYVVQRIFREIVGGSTIRAVVRGLQEDGIPTPSQKRAAAVGNGKRQIADIWNRESVRSIIRNPFYKGEPQAYRWRVVKERRTDEDTGRTRTVRRTVQREKLEDAGTPLALPSEVCPALVDAKTWQAAQEQMQRNREEAARNNKYPKDQLLRCGYAFCAYCGRTMIARRNNGGMRYICSARYGTVHDVECTPSPDHGQRQLKHWLGVARFELRGRQIA